MMFGYATDVTTELMLAAVVYARKIRDAFFDLAKVEFFIDHTGRFVMHSFIADSELTGRKIVCDTYGGYAPVGGGSQSPKDYIKMDRSGLYAARWIAKHIVGSKLAHKALVGIAYVIGLAKPISVTIDTLGTACSSLTDEFLSLKIQEQFALTPSWITEHFSLNKLPRIHFYMQRLPPKGKSAILDALAWFLSLKN